MKPDYGIYLHRNGRSNRNVTFRNLWFEEVFKLEAGQFTLFTNLVHQNTEYAVSLDFGIYVLQEILETVKSDFIGNYTELLEFLINPRIKNDDYKFIGYQLELSLIAKPGPIFVNNNEEYSPLTIIRILEGGTFGVTYV